MTSIPSDPATAPDGDIAADGSDRVVDVAVVGGGPAGLSAATWAARYRRSVVVLDSGDYRAAMVERSHGYLGRDAQRPADLIAEGRKELGAYDSTSVEEVRVDAITRTGGLFQLGDLRARRVVLACGVRDVLPDVEGFEEHYGASAFHCASCDGYEARDRHVVALGWGEHVPGFALSLLNWASSVTVVTEGHPFAPDDTDRDLLASRGVTVTEERAVSLLGSRGDLQGVRLASGALVEAGLLFFSIAHEPQTYLAVSLGCELDDDGYVRVNDCGETTVPGVYAAGDLVPGLQLVAVAAATGVVAGVGAAQSLS